MPGRAAPAVSCANLCKETHTSIQVQRRQSGIPCAAGFNAYAALSPATNSSCHRYRRTNGLVAPGSAEQDLRRLDTSNGCQDHTVLPSADRLHQEASMGRARPPSTRDGGSCNADLGQSRSDLFFREGLDW
jgi:hypothetical protein